MKNKLIALALCIASIAVAQPAPSMLVQDFISKPDNCRSLKEVIKSKSVVGLSKEFVIDMDEAMDDIWKQGEKADAVMTRLSEMCQTKAVTAKI